MMNVYEIKNSTIHSINRQNKYLHPITQMYPNELKDMHHLDNVA